MAVVLLDTNVASYFVKRDKGTLLTQYEPHMRGKVLAISFQSVAELWGLAEDRNWGEKRKEGFEAFIRRFLVIPYNYELAKVWAKVMFESKKQGRRFEAGDCWVASTAVKYGIPLLTHDRDFISVDIPGLNVVSYTSD